MKKGKCGWTPSIKLHWGYLCLLSLNTGGQRVIIKSSIPLILLLAFISRICSAHPNPSTHQFLFPIFFFPLFYQKKNSEVRCTLWDSSPQHAKISSFTNPLYSPFKVWEVSPGHIGWWLLDIIQFSFLLLLLGYLMLLSK